MTWTVDASGTQTATIGVEEVLVADDTNNGTYAPRVRLTTMQIGDVTEFRIYTLTLSTDTTLEQVWKRTIGPVPPINDILDFPAIASDVAIKYTLLQVAGTGRTYRWTLRRI